MATTALNIISRAASMVGVKIIGQDLSSNEQSDYLALLNDMIESWANDNFLLYRRVEDTETLTVGTASYTIGPSGAISTTRPQVIKEAFIRDSSNDDHPVEILPIDQYWDIRSKGTTGRPFELYYDPGFKEDVLRGTIYLYYTPDAAETLHLESLKELGSFAATDTSVVLPPGYNLALWTNLAIFIGRVRGKKITADMMEIAKNSMNVIKRRNIKHLLKNTRLEVAELNSPSASRSRGNISTGWS